MSVNYQAVLWNRHKKIYDLVMIGFIVLYIAAFVIVNKLLNPEITDETLIIRATGSLAIILLHVVLSIGPLTRLNSRFLPLLYNRRHLGVATFLISFAHGAMNIIQFHTGGDTNPLVSIFISNPNYGSFIRFPFQPLGFIALVILLIMAVTSHDFWMKNLGPKFWKAMHMWVYVAYALVVMHVMLGVVQSETSPTLMAFLSIGMIFLITLHLSTGKREYTKDTRKHRKDEDKWIFACSVYEIDNNEARVVHHLDQSIAIFRYDGKISAVSNVCKHQNGPLGEGKVIDGCITCPWHGFQYVPHNGRSPEPFTEKIVTYNLKLKGNGIWVNPAPNAEGEEVKPLEINHLYG